jgi:hypothetical protein
MAQNVPFGGTFSLNNGTTRAKSGFERILNFAKKLMDN